MGGIRTIDIGDKAIIARKFKAETLEYEIPLPIVVDKQSVTSATLTTLNGYAIWKYARWKNISKVEVELEYESAGAGDIDLYNITDGSKLADLVAPSAATSHTISRIDVTSAITGLSADKTIGIQAAGDGTNAITVYSAKLVVYVKVS